MQVILMMIDTIKKLKLILNEWHLYDPLFNNYGITDTNKMFVSKTEKDRWNNTNTKAEITTLIAEVNETITNKKSKSI